MSDSQIISLFHTNKIPATNISQNHLDTLHTALDNFCNQHKEYVWSLSVSSNRKIGSGKAVSFIDKHRPKTLHYMVESKPSGRELLINIDNGITLNLKNGSYLLYGLYVYLNDTLDNIKVPLAAVFLRRYWLFNSFFAGWFIPILIFLLFKNSGWAWTWLICFPIVLLMLAAKTVSDEFIEKLEWDDIVLSTSIQYKTYRTKVGSPLISLLSSTKTMISITASLATILSFIIYLAHR
jgi:hypothetical protein